MPVKVLQDLLGHTDISITLDTYSDVFENFQTENIQKIDNYMSTADLQWRLNRKTKDDWYLLIEKPVVFKLY